MARLAIAVMKEAFSTAKVKTVSVLQVSTCLPTTKNAKCAGLIVTNASTQLRASSVKSPLKLTRKGNASSVPRRLIIIIKLKLAKNARALKTGDVLKNVLIIAKSARTQKHAPSAMIHLRSITRRVASPVVLQSSSTKKIRHAVIALRIAKSA